MIYVNKNMNSHVKLCGQLPEPNKSYSPCICGYHVESTKYMIKILKYNKSQCPCGGFFDDDSSHENDCCMIVGYGGFAYDVKISPFSSAW